MASKECITEAVALTGAFSNAIRLAIIERLAAGPCLVGELAGTIGHGQAVVSKQLGILKAAGLLKCQHDGRCREYALADPDATLNLMESIRRSAALAARNAKRCREQQMEEHNA